MLKIMLKSIVKYLFNIGTPLAVVISYAKWTSIGWALVHGFFGWFYIVYYIIQY